MIDVKAPDRGCARFRYAASLHVRYDGSQLQAALVFLASHPRTRLVTLTIGADDVGRILDAVRSHYRGPLAVATYYSTTTDAVEVAGRQGLDAALAAQAADRSADLVDGFAAFRNASAAGGDPCAAHLLLPGPTDGCDSHPSRAGAKLLAAALVADMRSRTSPAATS